MSSRTYLQFFSGEHSSTSIYKRCSECLKLFFLRKCLGAGGQRGGQFYLLMTEHFGHLKELPFASWSEVPKFFQGPKLPYRANGSHSTN